jgi:hypothetical protein
MSSRERGPNPDLDDASPEDLLAAAAAASSGPLKPKAAAVPESEQGAPKPSPWPGRIRTVGATFYDWLVQPRVRLTVTGVILLLIGGLLVTSSVWTLPLIIAGAVMIVIAWIGHRLDGRLAVEWGETGAELEFRLQITGSQMERSARPRAALTSPSMARPAEPEPLDAEVVEGEAHTVEIEVADLKALIAAVETEESDIAQTEPLAQAKRNLRVAESDGRSAEAGSAS